MSNVHKVDPLTRHAWCYGLLTALLFDVEDEGEEAFDVRGGNIVSVRSLDQRFSFEVEDGDQAGHCERNKMSGRGRVRVSRCGRHARRRCPPWHANHVVI